MIYRNFTGADFFLPFQRSTRQGSASSTSSSSDEMCEICCFNKAPMVSLLTLHHYNFFEHLLLPSCWANFDQTLQECSLGGPL